MAHFDVLVVDDDPTSLRLMAATMQQLGYRARCVSNGDDALLIAQAAPPPAVVLDLMMPVMNGFEFLERFRQISKCRNVPVLVWTQKDLSTDEYARLQSTVQRVVAKGRSGMATLMKELQTFVSARRDDRQ